MMVVMMPEVVVPAAAMPAVVPEVAVPAAVIPTPVVPAAVPEVAPPTSAIAIPGVAVAKGTLHICAVAIGAANPVRPRSAMRTPRAVAGYLFNNRRVILRRSGNVYGSGQGHRLDVASEQSANIITSAAYASRAPPSNPRVTPILFRSSCSLGENCNGEGTGRLGMARATASLKVAARRSASAASLSTAAKAMHRAAALALFPG